MSDVNLGTVKASLEFDTSDAQQGAEKITRALKLTQEQIVALANATEDQRVKMIAAFEGTSKGAEQAAQSVAKWTDAQQRAAMSMSGAHDQANKLNAEYDKQGGLLEGLASKYGLIIGAVTAFAGAVLAVGKAYADSVAAVAEYSEKVEKAAFSTGLSAEAIQSLEKASTAAGISSDGLLRSIQRLEVAAGNDSKAFTRLGLSLEEVRAASPEEMLGMVMDKLIPMTDVVERNATAQKLLGRSFADAAIAYKEYEQNAGSYINLTTEQLAAGREMDSNLDALKAAWGELGKEIGAALNTPEVREGVKALAGAIRDMVIAVREGEGPIAFFFKMISTAAGTAAKDLVFLGGVIDGIKERMASVSKDTPGALARGMEALDAFQAKIDAGANKDFGNKMFPNLSQDLAAISKQFNPNKGPADDPAAAKKLQDAMDSLSGAKAQKEVDNLARAVSELGISGVDDLAGLGKQLVDLASKGATIPAALTPAIQAFAQQAAMKGVPQLAAKAWDEMTKTAEGNIKKQSAFKIKADKDEQAIAKGNQDAIAAINRSHTDMLQQQLRAGTLSVRQEYDLRREIIRSHGREEIDQLLKRRAAATDPAIIAALDEEIRKWNELTEAEVEATREMERFAKMGKLAGDIGNILGGIADVFDAIGISADSAIGKILGGLQQAAAAVQNFSQQTTTVGKISSGLSAAAGIFRTGQEKGALAGAGSGALTGAAIGTMIAPGIGTAVGAIAGALIGIGGALKKPEFKKIMNDVGKSWGVNISEGLAKEIEQIAKANKISRSMAALLDVSKIIGESGKDPREFTAKISDLMNAIKSGAVPAAAGLAELGRAFNQVAEAALKSGNIGDKALVGLLKRARELGEVTPEMKQFVEGQLNSAVEGVQKLIDVMPPDTAAKAGSSGALLAATFNAIAAEQGIVAASAALGPAYDQLMGKITEAGLAIPEALQSIGRQLELGKNKEFQAASGAASATSQVLTGLGNAGYMDTSVLGASADVAKQAFDQAKNAGATDKEAYQLIGGLLSDINNATIQSGQELSGLAQELISGANAEGVVIQGDQLSVLIDIRSILAGGGYTPGAGGGTFSTGEGGGFGGSGAEGGGITGRGDEGPTPIPGIPSVPYEDREMRHFAGGSNGVQDFGPGTPAMLHGKEGVYTEDQVRKMSGSGSSITFNPVFMTDPVQTNESRADLSQFQIDEFVRQVINNPLFQQILRDKGLRG